MGLRINPIYKASGCLHITRCDPQGHDLSIGCVSPQCEHAFGTLAFTTIRHALMRTHTHTHTHPHAHTHTTWHDTQACSNAVDSGVRAWRFVPLKLAVSDCCRVVEVFNRHPHQLHTSHLWGVLRGDLRCSDGKRLCQLEDVGALPLGAALVSGHKT